MEQFGIISAIVTPMRWDETLNLPELRRQTDRQLALGAGGVFCVGTNGEAYILSEAEKLQVIETVVDEAGGRAPVYAGTGCIGTADTIRLSRQAQALGADALSIVTPYFATLSQEELYSHYAAISDAVDLPMLLYHIPARTGNQMELDTVRRLALLPNVRGIKDSSGDPAFLQALIQSTRDLDFTVLSGADSLILPTLLFGGGGAVSAVTNVLPELVYAIYAHYLSGELEEARRCQEAIQPLRDCFRLGNPNTMIKRAANLMGHPVGPTRAPFRQLTQEAEEALRSCIATRYSAYRTDGEEDAQ